MQRHHALQLLDAVSHLRMGFTYSSQKVPIQLEKRQTPQCPRCNVRPGKGISDLIPRAPPSLLATVPAPYSPHAPRPSSYPVATPPPRRQPGPDPNCIVVAGQAAGRPLSVRPLKTS